MQINLSIAWLHSINLLEAICIKVTAYIGIVFKNCFGPIVIEIVLGEWAILILMNKSPIASYRYVSILLE